MMLVVSDVQQSSALADGVHPRVCSSLNQLPLKDESSPWNSSLCLFLWNSIR
jgi:hypothetical protein